MKVGPQKLATQNVHFLERKFRLHRLGTAKTSRQLKTARHYLMPLQQHLYNGLARPADYSIFVPEWTRWGRRASPCWQRNAACGHRGWLTASAACRTGELTIGTARDRREDGQVTTQFPAAVLHIAYSRDN